MTIILFISGILITFWGMFYVMQHKKKLSSENLVEFEKNIKPKLLKFLFLSYIPMIIISAYLLSDPKEIKISYFIYTGLASVTMDVFCYIQSKRIINQSLNAEHFKYASNYFIFMGLGLLFILSAAANTLRDYLIY